MNKIILFFLAILAQSTYSQKISRKDVSSFLSWEIKNNNENRTFIVDTMESLKDNINIEFLNKKGVLFTIEDVNFMLEQLKLMKTCVWNKLLVPNAIILNSEEYEKTLENKGWEGYREVYGAGFYIYSLPLFSKDKSKVVLQKDYQCGPLCGWDNIIVYEKNDKQWKLIAKLSTGHK